MTDFGFMGGGSGGGGGTNVLYANVAWVDAVNGNDLTGVIGDFTKPFATAQQATNTANSFGFTSTNRGLIYVRRGTYTDTPILSANIDTYCEPGVVYTAGGFVDSTTTGSVGIYGFAKFVQNARALLVNYSSTIYMEFDEIDQNTNLSIGAIEIWPTTAYTANVTMKGNRIYSNCRNAYAVTLRGKANLQLTVQKEIKGVYQVLYFRYSADGTDWTGNCTINCPSIIVENGGWAGNLAAYKNAIYLLRCSVSSVLTINGSVINNTIGYAGQGTFIGQSNNACTSIINGNIIGNDSIALYAIGASKVTMNGNLSSNNYCMVASNTAVVRLNNSTIIKYSNGSGFPAVTLDLTSVAYFNNCMISNYEGFGSYVIRMTNATALAYFYNCTGYSAGNASAYFVGTGGAAAKIGTLNTQSNKANDAACVEQFSVSGFSQNALLVLPNF